MVLLEEIWSGEGAPVRGRTESGKEIVLPVPYPNCVLEKGDSESVLKKLRERADIDTGNYYDIGEPVIMGEFVSVPYNLFFRI